ncbi:hypothetical protein HanIR_Chr15g0767271 [Helianthus annuus]|nr:hypothetical protein HanIR_Chr15g0767271 [Helianthus annuus]
MKIEFSLHFRSGGLFYFAAAEKKDLNDLASDVWSLTGIYDRCYSYEGSSSFSRYTCCTSTTSCIISSRGRVQEVTGATNELQQCSRNILPPAADDYFNNNTSSWGKPLVKLLQIIPIDYFNARVEERLDLIRRNDLKQFKFGYLSLTRRNIHPLFLRRRRTRHDFRYLML